MAPYRRRGERLIAAGRLPMNPPPPEGAAVTGPVGVSPFHQALYASPAWSKTREAEWFLLYRLMLNYTYLHLTRLGISPVERFLLGHLAANAVERRYGVSAEALIKRTPVPRPVEVAR
jgi:hypothetical protein